MDEDVVRFRFRSAVEILEPGVDRELVEYRVRYLQPELRAENRVTPGRVQHHSNRRPELLPVGRRGDERKRVAHTIDLAHTDALPDLGAERAGVAQ